VLASGFSIAFSEMLVIGLGATGLPEPIDQMLGSVRFNL
jgi:hypothetical protein